MRKTKKELGIYDFANVALPHLEKVLRKNRPVLEKLANRLFRDIKKGHSLFGFGSGHSALVSMELFHRAGGPSFFVPMILDGLLPVSGPKVVRILERSSEAANVVLSRFQPKKGEMLWIFSQSGINSLAVELATQASAKGIYTVAFTSVKHSESVLSRHSSGKKLYQICDAVVDLGGRVGDAALDVLVEDLAGPRDKKTKPRSVSSLRQATAVGSLSTLTGIFLAHSLLCKVMAQLEQKGIPCVYTSVNTPEGEKKNVELERAAALRDPRLR
ncbi:MAG: sugar isomerase domain-containing protein [Bdellovibrio sp.]|nr:sugar isomerase domain-containing protein [Bdellovibrio sp.]